MRMDARDINRIIGVVEDWIDQNEAHADEAVTQLEMAAIKRALSMLRVESKLSELIESGAGFGEIMRFMRENR